MSVQPVAPHPAAPASILTCSPAELRLATSAVYVAEMALCGPVGEGHGVDHHRPITVVCESGEHPEGTADIADLATSAGLGLLRLLLPALQTDVGDMDAGDIDGGPADQELVVTTRRQVHLIWILPRGTGARVVYVVLARDRGTVALARHYLRRHLLVDADVDLTPPVADAGRAAGDCTPRNGHVIPLNRPSRRRRTTSVRPAWRPAGRPGAGRRMVPIPVEEWACDDLTLRRVLAGLRNIP